MKITVAGMGYVGLPLAVLLAKYNEVCAYDTDNGKVDAINGRICYLKEEGLTEYLQSKSSKLYATSDPKAAFRETELVIISTPTNFQSKENTFDTSSVETVIREVITVNPDACIVIKSTIPVGFTEKMCRRYEKTKILFSPEFLREGRALQDNLYPSRIIVGNRAEFQPEAERFAALLRQIVLKSDCKILFMSPSEAEAVKLFSNTYLALRVSFFNEVDTYAESMNFNAEKVIHGICADPRIGDAYNNPSFGYGGYCLPKDTKQLLANYEDIPQNIIKAVVEGNMTRKNYIAERIWNKCGPDQTIGIYRLIMKAESDNYRESSILDVIGLLRDRGARLTIFEPLLANQNTFQEIPVVKSLEDFKLSADVIVANRFSPDLEDVSEKVYTRDIWHRG